MDQLAIARRALEDEIAALKAEVARLEVVLASINPSGAIGPTSTSNSPAVAPKRRGRPPKQTD